MRHAFLVLLTISGCFHARKNELRAEIEALQVENAALAQRLDSVETRLGSLEESSAPASLSVASDPEQEPVNEAWRDLSFDERLEQATRKSVTVTEQEASFFRNPDVSELSRSTRIIPWRQGDGEIGGFRMAGLRRNSSWDLAGFKNGDIVHAAQVLSVTCEQASVSKEPSTRDAWIHLSRMENLLTLVEKARGATAIEVLLTRRGTPCRLCIGVGAENSVLSRPLK